MRSVSRSELLRVCETELISRLDELAEPRLRRVINATGVLLHTNLGRARMAAGVADEAARVATEPVELEVDLRSNRRGGRSAGVERLLSSLTDAEGSAVVNNGAAALWLAVRSLARSGRAVVVSRGDQVLLGCRNGSDSNLQTEPHRGQSACTLTHQYIYDVSVSTDYLRPAITKSALRVIP